MENGYFQSTLPNHGLDEIPLPNEVPSSPRVPMEHLKSATVQSLLSQIDDLTARLSVALKRQLLLENENDSLKTSNGGFQSQFAAFSDQILIWKEKERLWKTKFEAAERELSQIRKAQFESENLENSLLRYKKYHEKVRTQIKPFIQNLKVYAESLGAEVRALNAQLEKSETSAKQREHDLLDKIQSLETQLQSERERQILIVQGYERAREGMAERLERLTGAQEQLLEKEEALRLSKSRSAELENKLIEMERHILSLSRDLEQKTVDLRSAGLRESELNELRSELTQTQSQNEDLKSQLHQQRLLWSNQASQLEELRASNLALEKINRELSLKKMPEMR